MPALMVIGLVVGVYLIVTFGTASGRANYAKQMRALEEKKRRERTPISQAGKQTAAGLACPKCGGTQFKTKWSGGQKAKAAAGFAVSGGLSVYALRRKTQVKCVTCGTVYARG